MRRRLRAVPALPVLVRQEDADRLLEALWRARVALNIARKRQRVGSPRYAVVPW